MAINTRQEFIDYCFRTLGAPVIKVNVDSTQAEDRLEEALDYMFERHFDFNQRAQFAYQITEQDVANKYFDTSTFGHAIGAQIKTDESGATAYWPAAKDIRSISRVYAPSDVVGDYMFDLRYQMTLFDFFGLYFNQSGYPSGPMASYMEGMSYIKLVNDVFNYPVPYTFTKTTERLTLDGTWKNFAVNNFVMIEAYVQIDTAQYHKVWNDRYFKRYYTALLKRQWAQNLSKFSNVALPGGASLNAPALMNEAVNEINAVEDALKKMYELPPDPFIG